MLLRVKSKKESGILMALSSLAGDYGIGSLGDAAYKFIDLICRSRQRYWQLLPLVPLGEGNSPYKSSSSFAGEILYIDLKMLTEDGLLFEKELPPPEDYKKTDYQAARKIKLPLLKLAAERFDTKNKDYLHFCKKNQHWLDDFAIFSSVPTPEDGRLLNMEEGLKYRLPEALERFKTIYAADIRFHKITQYLFFRQFYALKDYAHKNGIRLIGDLPFYVSLDSADVWSNPDGFKLGRDLTPVSVAGVPPDKFSSIGQLWGNPIYDLEYHRRTDYAWWKNRLKFYSEMYDVVRIDHFRAFSSHYCIPYGSVDARCGVWEKGAGLGFFEGIYKSLGPLDIIAEDLGGEEPEVRKLIADTGFPDMRVLQFAFDKGFENRDLPKNYSFNCVCYTGTHDNNTTRGWYKHATEKEKYFASKFLPDIKNFSIALRMISAAMQSKARMVIIPLQDYLDLPQECRMNTPGTRNGNWEWRVDEKLLTNELASLIKQLSRGRN